MPPERLGRWVAGFEDRHGPASVESAVDVVTLVGEDGATAVLEVPWPPLPGDGVEALVRHAATTRTALLVLVRRGGYGAALARDGVVLERAVGTRYVQGRTAAGGWSQQRFARRRAGQAAALVESAVDAALGVLSRGPTPDVAVPGGDRLLVSAVLGDRRLADVAALPRAPLLEVADPRLAVVEDAARRCRSVRVRITQ